MNKVVAFSPFAPHLLLNIFLVGLGVVAFFGFHAGSYFFFVTPMASVDRGVVHCSLRELLGNPFFIRAPFVLLSQNYLKVIV